MTKTMNLEKHAAYQRLWRSKNREKAREIVRRWRAKNYNKNLELEREWRKSNPEKVKEKRLKYYALHKEDILSRHRWSNRSLGVQFRCGRDSAKRRGISWQLSREDFAALRIGSCVYCQDSLSPTGCGLDRLDNSKGYEISNVVPACGPCNRIRNIYMTYEEMVFVMRALKEFRASNKPLDKKVTVS